MIRPGSPVDHRSRSVRRGPARVRSRRCGGTGRPCRPGRTSAPAAARRAGSVPRAAGPPRRSTARDRTAVTARPRARPPQVHLGDHRAATFCAARRRDLSGGRRRSAACRPGASRCAAPQPGTQRLSYGEKMTKRASTGSSPAPREEALHRAPVQQDDAFVELAVAHDALRQRVVGVVLEDDREPAGSHDAPQLGQRTARGVGRRRDAGHRSRRRGRRRVVVGKRLAVVGLVGDGWVRRGRTLDRLRGRVDAVQRADSGASNSSVAPTPQPMSSIVSDAGSPSGGGRDRGAPPPCAA